MRQRCPASRAVLGVAGTGFMAWHRFEEATSGGGRR